MPPKESQQISQELHIALYKKIAVTFLVLTAVLAGLALYVVFARATVTVIARPEQIETAVIVDVGREPAPGEIEGEVAEIVEDVVRTFPAASVAQIDAPAEGTVRIRSSLGRPQTLVATTRLLTSDNVMFRLKETVTIPAGGSKEAAVYADQPGASGNLTEAVFTIPGLNPDTRKFFDVRTVGPLAGGVRDMKMVTKKDIEAATEVVKEKVRAEMQQRLKERAGTDCAAETCAEIYDIAVDAVKTDAAAGAEVGEYTLIASVRAVAVFYDRAQFDRQIEAQLKALLPPGRRLTSAGHDGSSVVLDRSDARTGRANMRVTARGESVLAAEAAALAPAKIAGLKIDAARAYLEQVEGVGSVTIELSPFWARRLPTSIKQIKIELR